MNESDFSVTDLWWHGPYPLFLWFSHSWRTLSPRRLLVESKFSWGMRGRGCGSLTFSSLSRTLSFPPRSSGLRLLFLPRCLCVPSASPLRDASDVILLVSPHARTRAGARPAPPPPPTKRARTDKERPQKDVCAHWPFPFTHKPVCTKALLCP